MDRQNRACGELREITEMYNSTIDPRSSNAYGILPVVRVVTLREELGLFEKALAHT